MWDAEWVHAYSQYEERRRRMDEQEHAEFFGSSAGYSGSARDPLGYYQLMGLEPSCSKQEIQVRPAPLVLRSQVLSLLLQWRRESVDCRR